MAIRITTLTSNTAGRGDILGEWGLRILVETEGLMVLLDTGKSYTVTHNAMTIGIDLNKADKIVLSHGHCDHTGGLRDLLRRMRKKVEVIAHPDVWQPKYVRREVLFQ
jgi:7,8-dihydropterin-6-yl-methyl-4-(beta-D-ribofuranosyl)aminobenzene 5'-phosphate synthase